MPVLDRPTRRQLLLTLEAMPALQTERQRRELLQDLPPALVRSIPRDSALHTDLYNMIDACNTWEPASDSAEPHPLYLLVENAHSLAEGTGSAGFLGTLLQELKAVYGGSPAPSD